MHLHHDIRLTTLLALALMAGCAGASTTRPLESFRGSWIWTRSVGGVAGQVRTPASEGVTVRLEYDGRVARAFHDDQLVASTRYTATELPTEGPTPVIRVVYAAPFEAFPFDVLDEHTVLVAGPDSVQFVDPCCDRWSHVLAAAITH